MQLSADACRVLIKGNKSWEKAAVGIKGLVTRPSIWYNVTFHCNVAAWCMWATEHEKTLACPIVPLFCCRPYVGGGAFFTCRCSAKLSKREPPPGQTANATRQSKGGSVTQARGQLNSICFNSGLLAGMLVLHIHQGLQPWQKSSSAEKTKAWSVGSSGMKGQTSAWGICRGDQVFPSMEVEDCQDPTTSASHTSTAWWEYEVEAVVLLCWMSELIIWHLPVRWSCGTLESDYWISEIKRWPVLRWEI